MTRCDGSIRSGSGVYADFGKIGRPCTCIVTSSFVGKLHVTSWRATYACNNKVTVNKTVVFNCKNEGFKIYNVQINDTIVVKAEYQPGHTSERFYQCMGFIKYSKYIQIHYLNTLLSQSRVCKYFNLNKISLLL